MKTLVLFFLGILALGCSMATRPNVSVPYWMPTLRDNLQPLPDKEQLTRKEPLPAEIQKQFERLFHIDPSVAVEVGRLPKFQNQPAPAQVLSLTRLTDLVANATKEERANLEGLLRVGIPEVRRYCTPLQAILWILERDEYPEVNPLRCSHVESLLVMAWNFAEENRWNNYKVVTERLNAPELVDYYQRKRFTYYYNIIPGRDWYKPDAYNIFKYNRGGCIDFTDFAVVCLLKGGYKAVEYRVASPTGHPFHAVCLFKKDGKKYIMDNGRGRHPKGIVPFESYHPF
jgi:hypothetical protein